MTRKVVSQQTLKVNLRNQTKLPLINQFLPTIISNDTKDIRLRREPRLVCYQIMFKVCTWLEPQARISNISGMAARISSLRKGQAKILRQNWFSCSRPVLATRQPMPLARLNLSNAKPICFKLSIWCLILSPLLFRGKLLLFLKLPQFLLLTARVASPVNPIIARINYKIPIPIILDHWLSE